MARYLVTGALPYSNGRLHVGHVAGAYLPADIYVRFLRLGGHEVRFICGSDDNGVAALKKAGEENRPVEQLTGDYRERQRQAFAGLGVHFDLYSGTHSFEPVDLANPDGEKVYELHNRVSQDFFTRIYKNGYFTKKATRQLYDEQARQFLPDRFVKGKCPKCGFEEAYGDQCENCGSSLDPMELISPVSLMTGSRPVVRETVHWYLRLQDLADVLKKWLEEKKAEDVSRTPSASPPPLHFPWRPSVLNFALGQLQQGLPERAMTRDLTWGVPVPLDDPDAAGKSLYVWFDAPIGYVSFTAVDCARRGESPQAYQQWWQDPDVHVVNFIGEDNTVFHALTWPAMLLATHGPAEAVAKLNPSQLPAGGYQLASVVCANAYLNFQLPSGEITKQSKSRGTAVFIDEYLQIFDPDPLRYYLTSIAPEGARTAFSWDDFFARNNNELVNTLGNFVNRYQKILAEHFARRVPQIPLGAESQTLLASARQTAEQTATLIQGFEFKRALETVMQFVRDCNVWINERAPWNRVNPKKDLPGKPVGELDVPHAGETIYTCLQATHTLGTLLTPFLPFTGEKIRAMLNVSENDWTWANVCTPLPAGHEIREAPLLFTRLDPKTAFATPEA